MHLSIRSRLTFWYVAALALTLVALGLATYLLTRASLLHWLDETLQERAEALAEEVQLVEGEPRLEVPEHLRGTYEGRDDGFLVLDGRHRVVLARGFDPELLGSAPSATVAFAGTPEMGTITGPRRHRWRIASHPVLADAKPAAVVVVGHDLDEVDEVLERMLLTMLALLPLGLAVAGAGGYVLAGRALAPVGQIVRTAAEISETDLSRRLPVEKKDELGRLATTFNALIERLQRAFERQRQFTADASHELRTPLAIIRAVTTQQLMQPRTAEVYERALRQIDDASGYMARLVNHLLVLARADAGQVRLEREGLNLAELLENVAGQVGEATGRSIPVRAGAAVPVNGDPVRLTELFLNLLENAAKYTPPEGTVQVRVEEIPGAARVIVEDTGMGIPAEYLPHIFERFYRVDRARAREEGGTGLGLAISRWIAEAHGGGIEAASEPGRGTTMTVILPRAEEELS
jgi:heavy metal sensor kinase